MKNILLIALLAITALSAQAAEIGSADCENQAAETTNIINDSDMQACLNAYDEQLQSQVFENLFEVSSHVDSTGNQTAGTEAAEEDLEQLFGDLIALDTNSMFQAL